MAKPVTTMNPEKKRFMALLQQQGFRSINQFAEACGMSSGNVHLNLSGYHGLSIERAFRYADTLGLPVSDILEAFFYEETKKNKKAVRNFKKPVDD